LTFLPRVGAGFKPAPIHVLEDQAHCRSVGSTSRCPVFVAHDVSASAVDGPAGLEAVDTPAGVGDLYRLAAIAILLPVSFLVRPQDRFFVPTCAGAMTPRAGGFVVLPARVRRPRDKAKVMPVP
jgi:hypothetical protein